MRDCKAIAAKRRRQSTRLENLGIPEDVLLQQQQELFAKVSILIILLIVGTLQQLLQFFVFT